MSTLSYGTYLRTLRGSRALTISELSKAIGISSQYLSEIERGGRKCLNDEKAAALRDKLSLSDSEYALLSELKDKCLKRCPLPDGLVAFLEENPDIVSKICAQYGF